jgi:hypothetical protein
LWVQTHKLNFARDLAAAAQLSIVAAGSPSKAQSGLVASAFDAKPVDDLRAVLTEADADLVLLMAVGEFASQGMQEDARALSAAKSRNVKVASLEPIPASALELDAGGWKAAPHATDGVRFLGLPRLSRSMREAAESLAAFGQARTILVESWGGPAHGSLGARVFWALDLALQLVGEPETIDAAFHPLGDATATRSPRSPSLTELHGDLTATLRGADGRLALLAASNRAGRWNAAATLVSDQGRLRFYDDGFEWIAPDGTKRDELRLGNRREGSAPDHAVAVMSDALVRLMDSSMPDPAPVNLAATLGVAQAALLSARTGQPESPGTIRRMMAVGDSLQ